MQDVRAALASVLQGDPTLVAMLGSPTDAIVNEHDLAADPNVPYPVLSLTYQGSRPFLPTSPSFFAETWTIRCYDRENGYARIGPILDRVKALLNHLPFPITSSTRSVLDVTWTWDTPDYYDDKFLAENAGCRFRILVVDQRFDHS